MLTRFSRITGCLRAGLLASRGTRVSSATDAAHRHMDGAHRVQASRRGLVFSPTYENTRPYVLQYAGMPVRETRIVRGITFAYTYAVKPGLPESRLQQTETSPAAGGPLILGSSARRGVLIMVYKVLGILLCVGVMSLVSGCYCYPPGYYPHPHRYSSVPSYRAYAHHAWGSYDGR